MLFVGSADISFCYLKHKYSPDVFLHDLVLLNHYSVSFNNPLYCLISFFVCLSVAKYIILA